MVVGAGLAVGGITGGEAVLVTVREGLGVDGITGGTAVLVAVGEGLSVGGITGGTAILGTLGRGDDHGCPIGTGGLDEEAAPVTPGRGDG